MWPRNPALKMGTNLLSVLLSTPWGPSLITAPSFSLFLLWTHTRLVSPHSHSLWWCSPDEHLYFPAHWICPFNCIIILCEPWIGVVFVTGFLSGSKTEMSTEVLLLMTASQSHNWPVDMSLSITDLPNGAGHWYWWKESLGTSIIQLSTVSSFYLTKPTSSSTLQLMWGLQELLLQALFPARSN